MLDIKFVSLQLQNISKIIAQFTDQIKDILNRVNTLEEKVLNMAAQLETITKNNDIVNQVTRELKQVKVENQSDIVSQEKEDLSTPTPEEKTPVVIEELSHVSQPTVTKYNNKKKSVHL